MVALWVWLGIAIGGTLFITMTLGLALRDKREVDTGDASIRGRTRIALARYYIWAEGLALLIMLVGLAVAFVVLGRDYGWVSSEWIAGVRWGLIVIFAGIPAVSLLRWLVRKYIDRMK